MKITYLFSVCCCLFVFVANAQEGIWPVEKLPQIKEKLIKAGLKLDIKQIYREQEDKLVAKPSGVHIALGRPKVTAPFDSTICLNEAVFDTPDGNAALISSSGLAIGVVGYDFLPDSLLELIDPMTGVWVAKPKEEFYLSDFFAKSVSFTFDLNENTTSQNISGNILYRYYSERQLMKQDLAWTYDDEEYFYYSSDYYYRNNEALGSRTLSKAFRDVRLVALIENSKLSENARDIVAIFRLYTDQENRPTQYVADTNQFYRNPHFLPISDKAIVDSFHLVMGFPDESYFHMNSFMLKYTQDFEVYFKQVLATLSAYDPEFGKSFSCDCDDIEELNEAIEYHLFTENLFKNHLGREPTWKQEYGELLRLIQETYEKQVKLIPAIVHSAAILEDESSFKDAIRLVKDWRDVSKTASNHLDENYFLYTLSHSRNPSINIKSLVKLFELYFTKLPLEHISPYAKQQLANHKNNYEEFVNELFLKSPFFDTTDMANQLKQHFSRNIEKFANAPVVALLDSMTRHYQQKINRIAYKYEAFANHYNELLLEAMNVVLHRKPLYPDADRSLRISYGKLSPSKNANYLYSNAHLLPSHIGSPAINNQGQIFGIVGALSPEAYYNMYEFDVKKSSSTVIPIQYILESIAQHAQGKYLLQEIGK